MVNFRYKNQNQIKSIEPLPADPLGRRLCQIFSHPWQPIVAPMPTDVTEKPDWRTITRYPLRPRVLWDLWQDAEQLVGVRFDHTTTYAMIDVDASSSYHPVRDPEAITKIRSALETIGICRMLPIRSSWSKGMHLYIPLPESVPTFNLAVALKQALEAQGFLIRQGQIEIFPNVKSYGRNGQFTEYNAHRLPLQPGSGSVLLDDDLYPIEADLASFFRCWEIVENGQDIDEVKKAIAQASQTRRSYPIYSSNKTKAWQEDLLSEIEQGWTGRGQTNCLLESIACYGVVFQALSDDALVDFVEQTAINCPGYQEWCRHQHEIRSRASDWAAAAERHYWPIGSAPKRSRNAATTESDADGNNIVPFNVRRAEEAQERIRQAVAELKSRGELPEGVTARMKAIAAQAKCSFATLQKNHALWYPQEGVISTVEANSAEIEQPALEPIKTLNPSSDQELHTFSHMKGLLLDSGWGKNLRSDRIGVDARRGEQNPSSFPQALGSVLMGLVDRFVLQDSPSPEQPGYTVSDVDKRDRRLVPRPVKKSSGLFERFPERDGFNDVIMQIRIRFDRLGWSALQILQFLAERFPGKRFVDLTNDELLFLLYLLQGG